MNVPPKLPRDDAEWEALIRAGVGIGFHPVGTCRMGADTGAVVDPALKVRGVQGLRVIDASIMPVMPNANTNAPAIMIGEKGADLVKSDLR
jgi:choline dehydrogenase